MLLVGFFEIVTPAGAAPVAPIVAMTAVNIAARTGTSPEGGSA
jgi:hypothetical protein